MRRLAGPLLMATGVLDLLYVLVLYLRQLAAIAAMTSSTPSNRVPFSIFNRETVFRHLVFGVMAVIRRSWLRAAIGRAKRGSGTSAA